MRVSQLLSLVATPLAAAAPTLPADSKAAVYNAGRALEKRDTLSTAAQFDFAPFALTELRMNCSRSTSNSTYSCGLRFDWFDPNSVRENTVTTCTCTSSWSWDEVTSANGEKNTYSTQYSVCYKKLPNFFQMKFAGFNTAEDFTLDIAHHYQDSENFTAPWIYPTTFAKPNLHLPIIKREENLLQLYEAGPVYATITGLTA